MIREGLDVIDAKTELRNELYEGLNKGVGLLHNGEEIEEYEIDAVLLLMEESDYMREYVSDQRGKIIQVNYEQININ